jgi:hypothetical protein
VQALPLSTDQKPERPDEKARIIAHGGRVEPLPGPPGECGPARVFCCSALSTCAIRPPAIFGDGVERCNAVDLCIFHPCFLPFNRTYSQYVHVLLLPFCCMMLCAAFLSWV